MSGVILTTLAGAALAAPALLVLLDVAWRPDRTTPPARQDGRCRDSAGSLTLSPQPRPRPFLTAAGCLVIPGAAMSTEHPRVEWPDAHPEHGPALDKATVAEMLGWSQRTHVDVAIKRTRAGTARVPFPEAAGHAVPPLSRNGVPAPYWWSAHVEAYRDTLKLHGRRAKLTPALVARIRRMLVDKTPFWQIARDTGVSIASVSRIANGKVDANGARVDG